MRWEDESYVKLYVRDTLTWLSWSWQARTVFLHLLRKVDAAGLLECEGFDPSKAVAIIVGLPEEVTEPGLRDLARTGTIEVGPGRIIVSKFVEAQEARKTERLRKKDQRQRDRDKAREQPPENTHVSHAVTRGHAESHGVTRPDESGQKDEIGHTASRDVTRGHPPASASASSSSSDVPGEHPPAPPPLKLEVQKPERPPRKPSAQERFAAAAEESRRERMGAAWKSDTYPASRLNGMLRRVPSLDRSLLASAYAEFLDDPKKGGLDPPWPLWAFASDLDTYLSRAARQVSA